MLDKVRQELNKRKKLVSLPKRQELKIEREMSVSRISDIISDKLVKRIENKIANKVHDDHVS